MTGYEESASAALIVELSRPNQSVFRWCVYGLFEHWNSSLCVHSNPFAYVL